MLTIFSTPKPFRGHNAIIQRNAIESWTHLHPGVDVIIFGDEDATAEACYELGVCHDPRVERSSCGTKLLNHLFQRASEKAHHDVLCYVNCDIVLADDFRRSLSRALLWRDRFMMIGRRWDTDVSEPIDFKRSDWQREIQAFALTRGT